jgi:hypothetical protein
MLCALTVRRLKPGSFESFREAFMRGLDPGAPPDRWVRFDMVRGTADPDEVVCFGFFDGTLADLREQRDEAAEHDYDSQQAAIADFVLSTPVDGVFEVVGEFAGTPG